jgi:hypothetical protein
MGSNWDWPRASGLPSLGKHDGLTFESSELQLSEISH